MALNGWFQPSFLGNHVGKKLVNMSTDTFIFGLIAGPSGDLAARTVTEGYEFVSQLLANNGTALTEVSTVGTGYTRQDAASIAWSFAALINTFTCASPEWNPATFTACYGWIHDETASSGTDATRPLLAIYDFGGPQSPSGVPFELTVNASGIWTDTASQ